MKHVLICGLFMVLASELQSRELSGRPTPAEAERYLTEEANRPPSKTDYGDPGLVAKRCSVDYQNALKGVLQKNAAALKQLLLSSKCMDGASAEEHADVLRATLAYIGDADFSEALKRLPSSILTKVAPLLLDIGDPKPVQRGYPKTWAFLKRYETD